MAHPELGSRILDGVISAVGPAAKVENEARLEGRNMSMVLAPDKKAQEAMKKAAEEAAAELAAQEMASPDSTATESDRRQHRHTEQNPNQPTRPKHRSGHDSDDERDRDGSRGHERR